MKKRQRGITMVEFAGIAVATFMLLFAVVEFGRLFYSFSVLNEGMRRAARLAAVCPINAPQIRDTATLDGVAGVYGFNPFRNVSVQYLDANGNLLPDPNGSYNQINYVRVQVVDYLYEMFIPFTHIRIRSPSFAVTLPRESLGVSPANYINCNTGFGP